MAAACSFDRRVLSCGSSTWRTIWRRERVVQCASVGEGSRAETAVSSPPSFSSRSSEQPSSSQSWSPGAESTASGPGNNVVTAIRANRGFRLIRAEGRRLVERRLAAFLTAVALTALAVYGQDLISELGRRTSLPVEELDGIIYFVICFIAVSMVLPKSRYSK